jgi:hypothetical protein
MGKIIRYKHHGRMVYVDEDLKGKHREYCLCFRCAKFHPEDGVKNCSIANLNYAMDVLLNVVTPVWECPRFEEKPPLKVKRGHP